MKIETIDQISELIQTGKTPPTNRNDYFNGLINWFTPSDFKNKYLDDSERKISQSAIDDNRGVLFPDNAVLVTCIGEIGKVGIIRKSSSSNQQITAIKTKNHVYPDYLYYWIKTNKVILEKYSNNAVVPILNNAQLKKIKIPLPPLSEQKRIVEILDRTDALRQKRKQAIELLDEYLKATFLEMFGDPVSNTKGWEVKRLGNITTKIINGTTPKGGKHVYVKKGIIFFRSQNVWKNKLVLDNIAYIDETTHKKMRKSSLKNKDILMTKTGRINTENSSLGRAAMFFGGDDSANINGHVYLIRLQKNIIHEFVLYILTTAEYREYIRSVCVGGIDKRQINKEHLEEFPIISPPIELQNKFAVQYEKINDLKTNMLTSQRELNNLFNNLMQKAFNGEFLKAEDNKIEIISEEKVNPFFYLQIMGAVINILDKEELKQGEMVITKYLYLLDRLFKINTKLKYIKGNFGPYDRQIKISLNNKIYFKKEGRTGFEYFSLTDKKNKLFEKKYKETRLIEIYIPEIIKIFKKCDSETRSHKVELLATVGKIMEDSKSTDFDLIWDEMKNWKVEKRGNFKNKAEIFNEKETAKCVEFILKNGWDKKFIKV